MEKKRLIQRDRANSVLKDLISKFLLENANRDTLITVTHLSVSDSGNSVTVLCSVFPQEKTEQAYKFLKRRERDCRTYIKENSSLRILPSIHFECFGRK